MIASKPRRQGTKDVERIATVNARPYCGARESFPRPIPCHSCCIQVGLRWRMGISLLVMLLALPGVVHAQFTFTTNNGALTITGYTGPGGAVIILETTNGYPVKSIGMEAFVNLTMLSSVTIPHSVTNIGVDAFWSTGLTNVTIGNGVISIG